MALQYSTAVRNAELDALEAAIGTAPTTRARGDTSINSTGVINLTLDPVSVTVLAVRGTYGG